MTCPFGKLFQSVFKSNWAKQAADVSISLKDNEDLCFLKSDCHRFPQMTARLPPAVWRWPTGSPPWSRGSRCRRTRSSCWSQLWLTLCVGSTYLRSSRPWAHAEAPPKVEYTPNLLLNVVLARSWGIKLQKKCVFPSFSSLFSLFPGFPLLMSCHCPLPLPVCPLFSRPALLIALCIPRINPAKLRKSPSADNSVGKSGRLIVKSCLHWAAHVVVVLRCVLQ